MSRLTKPGAISVFLIAVFLCAEQLAFSRQSPPVDQDTVLTFVHDFLQIFYPELLSKGHRLKLSVLHPADSSWREISGVYFTVTPEQSPDSGVQAHSDEIPKPEVSPNPDGVLLDGRIWLPPRKYGRIQEVVITGYPGRARKIRDVRQELESQPDRSEGEVEAAFKHVGARFGPLDKEAFVRSLPFDRTERFLGQLKVNSVEFREPERDKTGRFKEGDFYWSVQADAKLPDRRHPTYYFSFEPFDGTLTALTQH